MKTVITVTQDKDELNKALTENLSKQTTGQTNTHKVLHPTALHGLLTDCCAGPLH